MTEASQVGGRGARMRKLMPFVRFAIVGGLGFAVDAGTLLVLIHGVGLGPVAGRLVSFAVAVLVTFDCNRRWTFRGHAAPRPGAAFAAYLAAQGLGFAVNFAVYTGLLLLSPPPLRSPLLCLAIASAVALAVNFTGARLIFRPAAPK